MIYCTVLKGVVKAIPEKRLFDLMTILTVCYLVIFSLGIMLAFAACPIEWSEFQGECLHFSRASRGWIDAAVSQDHTLKLILNPLTTK